MKKRMILFAGLAGLALLASPARAQYKITSDDGIAASPRVRMQLDERKARITTVEVASMRCPKCKDTFVSKPDTDPKGLGARTLMAKGTPRKLVATHLCPGCGTDWAVVGQGKAKAVVGTHKCQSCGAEDIACCSTKAGSNVTATKGMEKLHVAPVK